MFKHLTFYYFMKKFAPLEFDGSNKSTVVLKQNSWRNMLKLIRLISRSVTWLGIKMSRCSAICLKLRLQIEEQCQNNVSKYKIMKSLNIPSSTLLNIMKWYEEISVLNRHSLKRMPVILRTPVSTALKADMILSWKSLRGLMNTFRNHFLWTSFTVLSANAG